MRWETLGKFFLHGILFSFLFLLLAVAWILVIAILVSLGALIGLIIGFAFLFLVMGYINTILGTQIWNIEPHTQGISSFFFHGLALFIVLVIVNLMIILPNYFIPGIAIQAATFVIGAFLNGYIGKGIASWFGYEHTRTNQRNSEAEITTRKNIL